MVCGRGSLYKFKSAGRNDGVQSVSDGEEGSNNGFKKIRGTVVLMKKNVLDFNDVPASLLDRIHELVGKGVSLQLVSADQPDPGHPLSPPSLSLSLVQNFLGMLIALGKYC